jgi:hypothetical protein
MSFEVNGGSSRVEAMRILDDGNVGIGTTDPSNKLHVVGTDSLLAQIQNTTDTARMVLNGGSGTGGDLIFKQNGTSTWGIATIGDDLHFLGDDSTLQYRMTLDNSGNVGIGTTVPKTTYGTPALEVHNGVILSGQRTTSTDNGYSLYVGKGTGDGWLTGFTKNKLSL